MKRRHWTVAKKARVLEYLKDHSHSETVKKYKISRGQIWYWRQGVSPYKLLNRVAPHKGNGSAVHDAIVYLQHAEGVLKGKPSNAELFALLALRTLTGEITK